MTHESDSEVDKSHSLFCELILKDIEKPSPQDNVSMRTAIQELATELNRVVEERDRFRQLYLNMIDRETDRRKEAQDYWMRLKEIPSQLQEIEEIIAEVWENLGDPKNSHNPRKQLQYAGTLISNLKSQIKT